MLQNTFYQQLAEKYGLVESILITYIDSKLCESRTAGLYYYGFTHWFKCPFFKIKEYFSYITKYRLEKAFIILLQERVLQQEKFDSKDWDMTIYHTFTEEFKEKYKELLQYTR